MFAFPPTLSSLSAAIHDDDDDHHRGYGYDANADDGDDGHHDHVDDDDDDGGNLQKDVCACFAVMPLSGIRHPHAIIIIIIIINMIMGKMATVTMISWRYQHSEI